MYIETYPKSQLIRVSWKLFKRLGFKRGHPAFVQIVKIKGEDTFVIVKRQPSDTFKTQCCMLHRTPKHRTPAQFQMTIPSLEYISAITGMDLSQRKILKVKQFSARNFTYYKICNR